MGDVCWHCAPSQDVRRRLDPQARCPRCARDAGYEPAVYTAQQVRGILRKLLLFEDQARTPLAKEDVEMALEFLRRIDRLTDLERYVIVHRLIMGESAKRVALKLAYSESWVHRAVKSSGRKIAVVLNRTPPGGAR